MKRYLMAGVLALAACGGGDDGTSTPTGASLDGMWRTMVVNGPINGTLTMTLMKPTAAGEGNVGGTGTYVSSTETQTVTISGNFTDPMVHLLFVSGNNGMATFDGTLTTPDRMEGTHSAAGIGQAPMTIDRVQ